MAMNSSPGSTGGGSTALAQADLLLRDGQVSEALAAFQAAAQADPDAPEPQLGLAQCALAMGNLPQARATADRVRALVPDAPLALLAQAISLTAARDFDGALNAVEAYLAREPGRPYARALRSYLLRRGGQRYEAELARASAARAWGTRDFDHLFPPEALPPAASNQPDQAPGSLQLPQGGTYTPPRPWNERSRAQRQMTRVRFAARGVPIATYTLIALNVAVYLAGGLIGGSLRAPNVGYSISRTTGVFAGATNPLYNFGVEQGLLIAHQPWQVYRILTAMFLHEGLMHVGLNMLSLFFVGVAIEQFFGTRRFLFIYFASGIIAGAAQAILTPEALSLGASGAIFGIFGAFGALAFLRRQTFGNMGNAVILEWLLFLVFNLAYDFRNVSSIAVWAHLGGLIAGIIIGILILEGPRRSRARRSPL